MSQNTSPKPIQRILIILSGLVFAGSTVLGMVGLYSSAVQESKSPATTAVPSKDAKLKQEERGYEQVLQREPENPFALEKLAGVRIQMKDVKGAVEPLEKLVKLHPDRADYKAALTQVKQQAEKEGKANDR